MEAFHGEAEDGGEDEQDEGEEGDGSDHDAEADEVEGKSLVGWNTAAELMAVILRYLLLVCIQRYNCNVLR